MPLHKNCPTLKANADFCNCTYEPCPRKGNCCACVQYHAKLNQLPACFFPPEVERTYDRSFRRFVDLHK
jgi:hypothetical protein